MSLILVNRYYNYCLDCKYSLSATNDINLSEELAKVQTKNNHRIIITIKTVRMEN